MLLPQEILENIIRYNEDSARTLLSWAQISNYFNSIINSQIGIITILDGVGFDQHENILGYQTLFNPSIGNHISIRSDSNDLKPEHLKLFISRFRDLLIVVESKMSFSENLSDILSRIAYACPLKINISLFYKTHANFLSKLYFTDFKRLSDLLNLNELYIFGNPNYIKDENICDIDTLFHFIYISHINNVYSMDIINNDHHLFAPDLYTIRTLIYDKSNTQIDKYLQNCPNLITIKSMKFPLQNSSPLSSNNNFYNLPHCDNITLTDINNDVSYPYINGVNIRESLTLVPSLRAFDIDFDALYFPNIKSLSIKYPNISRSHSVNLINCNFKNIEKLICESTIIPWKNLSLVNNILNTLTVTLNDTLQLNWILSCPFYIKNLRILSYDITLLVKDNWLLKNNSIDNIFINITNLEQCRLFSLMNEINNYSNGSVPSLHVSIDTTTLYKSMLNASRKIQCDFLETNENNNKFNINIPYLEQLTMLSIGKDDIMNNILMESQIELQRRRNSLTAYMASDVSIVGNFNYSVSPSQFRKNSLSGLSHANARRQSLISIESPISAISDQMKRRRKSSISDISDFSIMKYTSLNESAIDDSDDDLIVFQLQDKCPDILTTDINSLESSLLSFKYLTEKRLSMLQITIPIDDVSTSHDMENLAHSLVNRVIDILNYPYSLKLPNIIIEKFQILLNLTSFNGLKPFNVPEKEEFCGYIQKLLAFKGHTLKVFNDTSIDGRTMDTPRVSVSITF